MFTNLILTIKDLFFTIYWINYVLIGVPIFLMKEGIRALIDMIR